MVDVDAVLVAWLTGLLGPTVRVATETPNDLAALVPFVKVRRVGGGVKSRLLDLAQVTVEVFGVDKAQATSVAGQIDDAARFTLPTSVGHVSVGYGGTTTGPVERPYSNLNVRYVQATYQLIIH